MTLEKLEKSPELLYEYVYQQVPELDELLATDRIVDAAFLLRRWVSSICSYPQRDILIFHWQYTVPEILRMLDEGVGGLWCGGTSMVFSAVLNAVGIPAAVYMYGAGEVSHETTVFGVEKDRAFQFYILDAYLNYHYVHSDSGQLLSIGDLFKLIRKKEYSHIKRVDEPIERQLVTMNRTAFYYKWLFPGEYPKEPIAEKSGHKIYAGAIHSTSKVLNGGPYRKVIDAARGEQPLDEFMWDLLLVDPKITPISNAPEAYPDLCLLRSLVSGLAQEAEWTR